MILLKKGRVHNLKGIDLALPKGALILFTGVSGSGKSSCAFDILYVEGQRRYVESLSTHLRRHMGELPKPDIESLTGLSPTLSVEQKRISRNPRSTVGTMTEIYDYLRLVYARMAVPHCPVSGEAVAPQSREAILSSLLQFSGPLALLSPYVRHRKGEFREELEQFVRRGFLRGRIDGRWVDFSEPLSLDGQVAHDIDIVIDRCTRDEPSRLAEALQEALSLGEGSCIVCVGEEERLFSTYGFSPASGLSYPPLEPQDFSFNHPAGMCSSCHGLGCATCGESRLKPYPAAARLQGLTLAELTSQTLLSAAAFLRNLPLSPQEELVCGELIQEICRRLTFLCDVGLNYLTLGRTAPTLSGGESQRVRLASQVGSGLVGVTYILDEPSIGLHPRDNDRLIETLKQLRDRGNTVIVVEHDEEMIRSADHIVDFGPGAGVKGGEIIASGPWESLLASPSSLTGEYLAKRREIPLPARRRPPCEASLLLTGAKHHNLKNIDVEVPLGCFVAITGVSGSGKSSLITETLYPALVNRLTHSRLPVGSYRALKGHENLDKIIAIDQNPIGRTARSNPVTYTKLFDGIRSLFAELPESRARGYTPSRFSFNCESGSCSLCRGRGELRIDMDFLEEAWVPCTACQRQRFDKETLSVRYKGRTIYDVLEMSIAEAAELFSAIPSLKRGFEVLKEVGLEYLSLGQSASTLSGGEAQRVKLAKELMRPASGRVLYLLDEPTTGLHLHDIAALLKILHTLVARGHTVLVIEHNMELVKTADWVLDLGPEGGEGGGFLLAKGTPEAIAQEKSPTGEALFRVLHGVHRVPPPPRPVKSEEPLSIKRAEQNYLKGLSCTLPRGKLTVCAGPSGAGKSSLAFETLYAEGQRRYVESLSPYMRQGIVKLPKPKVEEITGLSPAIAIEQKAHAGNPRSTVGTLTEVYDYLRLLFARAGTPHCPETGEVIEKITKEQVIEKIAHLFGGSFVHILAPMGEEEPFEEQRTRARQQGYLRLRLNGTLYELDEEIPYDRKRKNSLALVIDRFTLSPENRSRLAEAVENGLRHSPSQIAVLRDEEETTFHLAFTVLKTGKSYPEITPQTLSFNSPEGMCSACMGLGGACPACKGERLQPLARHLLLKGHSIASLCRLPIVDALPFIEAIPATGPLQEVLEQSARRLRFLIDVGLGYLSLDRNATTLSNGEAQRIRLSAQLGSGLTGVLYLLDEPTTGLHPADVERLLASLQRLKELGNTLLVVEHDPLVLSAADHVIELGPGAGKAGGEILFQGSYEALLASSSSPTGAYLSQRKKISPPERRRTGMGRLFVENATLHNLKGLSISFPLQAMSCLTGVSGSGKSTLLSILYARKRSLRIEGAARWETCLSIDQNPLGHSARADVGTYTEILTVLRRFYATLGLSRAKGLAPKNFSFNHRAGMCTHCRGMGYVRVERQFLAPVRVPCPHCKGMRLNPVSLEVKYAGKSFGTLYSCSLEEIAQRFDMIPSLKRRCKPLLDLGLGYLPLGQEIGSLSTGEAQRIKLGTALYGKGKGHTLYLLDEPSTGLHFEEIELLLRVLHRLVDQGNTVILIEHHVEMIRQADYVVELGPGAGEAGGHVVAAGTPEAIKENPSTITRKYL